MFLSITEAVPNHPCCFPQSMLFLSITHANVSLNHTCWCFSQSPTLMLLWITYANVSLNHPCQCLSQLLKPLWITHANIPLIHPCKFSSVTHAQVSLHQLPKTDTFSWNLRWQLGPKSVHSWPKALQAAYRTRGCWGKGSDSDLNIPHTYATTSAASFL